MIEEIKMLYSLIVHTEWNLKYFDNNLYWCSHGTPMSAFYPDIHEVDHFIQYKIGVDNVFL